LISLPVVGPTFPVRGFLTRRSQRFIDLKLDGNRLSQNLLRGFLKCGPVMTPQPILRELAGGRDKQLAVGGHDFSCGKPQLEAILPEFFRKQRTQNRYDFHIVHGSIPDRCQRAILPENRIIVDATFFSLNEKDRKENGAQMVAGRRVKGSCRVTRSGRLYDC
jgi:hypothetical protein